MPLKSFSYKGRALDAIHTLRSLLAVGRREEKSLHEVSMLYAKVTACLNEIISHPNISADERGFYSEQLDKFRSVTTKSSSSTIKK